MEVRVFQAPLEGIAVHSWHCLRAWLLQLVPKCQEKCMTAVVSAVMLKPLCQVSYRVSQQTVSKLLRMAWYTITRLMVFGYQAASTTRIIFVRNTQFHT